MSKKLYAPFALLILFSLLLGACGTPATEVVETTEAVAEVVATEVVPTEEPTAESEPTAVPLDLNAVFTSAFAAIAEKNLATIPAAKLNEELAETAPFLLDVRDAAELEKDGFIAGTVNVPIKELLKNLDKLPAVDQKIVVYCGSGHRGGIALSVLTALGYSDVRNLAGGIGAWKKAELPVVTGETPAAPEAISTPIVADEALFTALDEFLTNLPEGYLMVKPDGLVEMLASEKAPTLIDLRTVEEWNTTGYIEGAINVPFAELMSNLDKLPAKNQPIVLVCQSGHRGGLVLPALKMLGYENVVSLGGGVNGWKAAKMPVVGWVDWNVVWAEYLAALPEGWGTIKAADLNTQMAEDAPFILDVREASEVAEGYIPGAVNVPVRDVMKNLDKLPALDQPIVIYCGSGHRGGMAMAALQILGYTNVKNLAGGIGAWKKAELQIVTDPIAAPVAGTAAEVDATRLRDLDAWFSALPDGFNAIKPADLNTELASGAELVMVDLRTADEIAEYGYIEGSTPLAITALLADPALLPAKDAAVMTICQSGHRGGIANLVLGMLGWTNVRNINGGMNAWIAAELPVVK